MRGLAVAGAAALPAAAAAQEPCDVEQAQRLFGATPRPTAEIEALLAACEAAGSSDYRVPMFRGVMAREAGDRAQAIAQLRKAHALAPDAINPALELGFTLESVDPREARAVYAAVLARDPASRPAALGLARVARSQNRLDEARGLYARLLAADPADPEALNGMAWLALAGRDREQGRAGFRQVLAIDPGNEEAAIGLENARSVYRYSLAAGGTVFTSDEGTSLGYLTRGTMGISPFDTLELGWQHYTDELVTLSEIGLSTLPSDDVTVGYHRLVPRSYAVSLVYDYRGHDALPTEHWIDGSVTVYLTRGVRWFGGYRKTFGDARYDGRLLRTSLSFDFAPSWRLLGTVYNSRQTVFDDHQALWSGLAELIYTGPRSALLVAGIGASPEIDNLHLHVRATVPVADRLAVQLIATHDTSTAATSVTAGLLFTR